MILKTLDIDDIDKALDCIIIYLRKSRKDMDYYKEESIEKTLLRHEMELQDMVINIFGKPIPEKNIYREVASGDTIEDRPVMQEVLSIIESPSIKAVLCIEIERLARGNTIDQGTIAQAFRYTKTKIWTPMKIYNLDLEDDLSYFEDGLYQARKYLVYTKRILARGRLRSVKEGKYICSVRPYGYQKKKLINEKGYTLEIDEGEAKIVRMIFDLAYKDHGTSVIANSLNNLNIKPMKNDIWTPSSVRNILKNTVYIGKVTWNRRKTVTTLKNGVIVKSRPINNNYFLESAIHEAIIDKDIFDEVQRKISSKKGKTLKKNFELKNPLAGLIKCGMCGKNMIRRPYSNGQKDSLICQVSNCKNVSSRLDLVEKKLIESLYLYLQKYENKVIKYQIKMPLVNDKVNKVYDLKKEVNDIEKQLSKACDLLEKGIYTPDIFEKRKKELENKRNEILCKLDEEKVLQKSDNESSPINMIPKLEKCLNIYERIGTLERHKLLSAIIDSAEFIKLKGGRGYEDSFILKIRTKL